MELPRLEIAFGPISKISRILKLTVATNVVSLDVIESYVDILLLQVGVVLEVSEDFGHDFIAEVGITEHFKCGNVGPKEVSISVINGMRTLKI